jgi:hypothetical protein
MAYHSPITANDRAVNSSIDSFNSGLTYSGSEDDSVYTKGDVAMQAMPAMMQLGKVMKLRGELNEFTRRGNAAYAEDETNKDDQKAYEGYSKTLKDATDSGMGMADLMKTTGDYMQRNPDAMSSPRVKDAQAALMNSDTNGTQAAINYSTRKKVAAEQEVWENQGGKQTYQDSLVAKSEQALYSSQTARDAAKLLKEGAPQERENVFINQANQSGLSQPTIDTMHNLMDTIGYNGEDAKGSSAMGNISTSLTSSRALKDVIDSNLEFTSPFFKVLNDSNIDRNDSKAVGNYIGTLPLGQQKQYSDLYASSQPLLLKAQEAETMQDSLKKYLEGAPSVDGQPAVPGAFQKLKDLFAKGRETGDNREAYGLLAEINGRTSAVAGIAGQFHEDTKIMVDNMKTQNAQARLSIAERNAETSARNSSNAAVTAARAGDRQWLRDAQDEAGKAWDDEASSRTGATNKDGEALSWNEKKKVYQTEDGTTSIRNEKMTFQTRKKLRAAAVKEEIDRQDHTLENMAAIRNPRQPAADPVAGAQAQASLPVIKLPTPQGAASPPAVGNSPTNPPDPDPIGATPYSSKLPK